MKTQMVNMPGQSHYQCPGRVLRLSSIPMMAVRNIFLRPARSTTKAAKNPTKKFHVWRPPFYRKQGGHKKFCMGSSYAHDV